MNREIKVDNAKVLVTSNKGEDPRDENTSWKFVEIFFFISSKTTLETMKNIWLSITCC